MLTVVVLLLRCCCWIVLLFVVVGVIGRAGYALAANQWIYIGVAAFSSVSMYPQTYTRHLPNNFIVAAIGPAMTALVSNNVAREDIGAAISALSSLFALCQFVGALTMENIFAYPPFFAIPAYLCSYNLQRDAHRARRASPTYYLWYILHILYPAKRLFIYQVPNFLLDRSYSSLLLLSVYSYLPSILFAHPRHTAATINYPNPPHHHPITIPPSIIITHIPSPSHNLALIFFYEDRYKNGAEKKFLLPQVEEDKTPLLDAIA